MMAERDDTGDWHEHVIDGNRFYVCPECGSCVLTHPWKDHRAAIRQHQEWHRRLSDLIATSSEQKQS